MSRKTVKHLISAASLTVLLTPALLMTTSRMTAAQTNQLDIWGDPLTTPGFSAERLGEVGLGRNDPRLIATRIIQIVLGLLGIIAVVIILYGGFMWMTARGNDDGGGTARKILGAGIIGLLIVLAAWALAIFIINRFLYSTGADTSGIISNDE